MGMRTSVNGEPILRDLDRIEVLTTLIARRFLKMKQGEAVEASVLVNINKARDAIKEAYEALYKA